MPKSRKAPLAASASPPTGGDGTATPAPPATLHITPWALPAKQVLHRVHEDLYKADQFNPGLKGNARFSPIRDAQGEMTGIFVQGHDVTERWRARRDLERLQRKSGPVPDRQMRDLDRRYLVGRARL